VAQRENALVVDASIIDGIEIKPPMFDWDASLSGLSQILLYDKDALVPTSSTLTRETSRN
jgi:hypothetical protein